MREYNQKKTTLGDVVQPITYTQKNFLEYCKKIGHGDITIILRDGQPVQSIRGNETKKIDIKDTWKLSEYLGDIKNAEVTMYISNNGDMIVKKVVEKQRFDIRPE